MKNFNILGVHRKIRFLTWGSQKTNIEGEDCLKRGRAVCRFKREFGKKGGGGSVFEGEELRPQCKLLR